MRFSGCLSLLIGVALLLGGPWVAVLLYESVGYKAVSIVTGITLGMLGLAVCFYAVTCAVFGYLDGE